MQRHNKGFTVSYASPRHKQQLQKPLYHFNNLPPLYFYNPSLKEMCNLIQHPQSEEFLRLPTKPYLYVDENGVYTRYYPPSYPLPKNQCIPILVVFPQQPQPVMRQPQPVMQQQQQPAMAQPSDDTPVLNEEDDTKTLELREWLRKVKEGVFDPLIFSLAHEYPSFSRAIKLEGDLASAKLAHELSRGAGETVAQPVQGSVLPGSNRSAFQFNANAEAFKPASSCPIHTENFSQGQ